MDAHARHAPPRSESMTRLLRPVGARGTSATPTIATMGVDVGARTEAVGMVHTILLVHVRGIDGLCVGCLDLASFAWSPCPEARGAQSMMDISDASDWSGALRADWTRTILPDCEPGASGWRRAT
jgi:hypothetical protein